MGLTKERIFRHILVEDTYVVWLSGPNRFLQLKEPAFFVFEAWANGENQSVIAGYCSSRYELPHDDAFRFTGEIIIEIEKLYKSYRKDAKTQILSVPQSFSHFFSKQICRINSKTIWFKYGEIELENLFRPLFRQFETETKCLTHGVRGMEQRTEEKSEINTIEFFKWEGRYYFKVNNQEVQQFEADDAEHFQGAVLKVMLNLLHGKTGDDWMGIFHASAVSNGKEALLFLGASGSGKSTLATLMVAHGYQLISDDFVPVALEPTEVYPLPTAISVKKNAIPFLKDYFPSLTDEEEKAAENDDWEVFLPLPEECFAATPVKAKAILFIQYDPDVEFRLTRESNLTVMNAILKQSWIANNPYAAERFLNWYFGLPVYTLTYSDGEKMVREIKLIFGDVNDS